MKYDIYLNIYIYNIYTYIYIYVLYIFYVFDFSHFSQNHISNHRDIRNLSSEWPCPCALVFVEELMGIQGLDPRRFQMESFTYAFWNRAAGGAGESGEMDRRFPKFHIHDFT